MWLGGPDIEVVLRFSSFSVFFSFTYQFAHQCLKNKKKLPMGHTRFTFRNERIISRIYLTAFFLSLGQSRGEYSYVTTRTRKRSQIVQIFWSS